MLADGVDQSITIVLYIYDKLLCILGWYVVRPG